MGVRSWGWKQWLPAGIIVLAAGVVGGPFIYINFIEGDPPPPLSLATSSPSGTPLAGSIDGTWKVSPNGTVVGYRVKEQLFGQSNVAYGRTSSVTGTFVITGTTVSEAKFTADMSTVASDQDRRDRQFRGRIMDTATHPKATFELAQPVALGSIPAEGVEGSATVTGKLTLRGTTKTVTVKITGKRTGGTIQVAGTIPIVFAEWRIPNPSFGPSIQTEDRGILEFLLVFTK